MGFSLWFIDVQKKKNAILFIDLWTGSLYGDDRFHNSGIQNRLKARTEEGRKTRRIIYSSFYSDEERKRWSIKGSISRGMEIKSSPRGVRKILPFFLWRLEKPSWRSEIRWTNRNEMDLTKMR